jgi:UTP--glucose-1-phosphate uridylyltransferase
VSIITKAIIPAGGLGTRFLPATKSTPKEMLPLLDKPAIQYIVEEGYRSGIKNFVLITSKHKGSIEDHFDTAVELDALLKSKDKDGAMEGIRRIVETSHFAYIRQREPLGLGHAIWSARHVVGKESIAIFLPDDVIISATPCMGHLMQIATQEKCNVVAVQEVPSDQVSNYGIVAIRKQFSPNLFQVKELVEKPSIADAPSNLAIVGRYVLSSTVFDILDEQKIGAGGEIQLTDAIQAMLLSGEKVFAYRIQGTRYDVGTPMGFIKANIDLALRDQRYSATLIDYLKEIDRDYIVMEGQVEALAKGRTNQIF